MRWRSLSSVFAPGLRRRLQARAGLGAAYRRLFSGSGSKADAEMVLADLASHTGFYRVTEPGAGSLDFAEGKRAVFGRLFRFLRMTEAEIEALEEAARAEALADAREGEI
jgi:hypothetical protein